MAEEQGNIELALSNEERLAASRMAGVVVRAAAMWGGTAVRVMSRERIDVALQLGELYQRGAVTFSVQVRDILSGEPELVLSVSRGDEQVTLLTQMVVLPPPAASEVN